MNKNLEKIYIKLCERLIPPAGRPMADARFAQEIWDEYVLPAYRLGKKNDPEPVPEGTTTGQDRGVTKDMKVTAKELQLKDDFKRKDWTHREWMDSEDDIDRLVWFISSLSPHNLWKAKEAIRTYTELT